MNNEQIEELAAILIRERGPKALGYARRRRLDHRNLPGSELFRLWSSIAAATARLLQAHESCAATGGARRH